MFESKIVTFFTTLTTVAKKRKKESEIDTEGNRSFIVDEEQVSSFQN